MKTLKTPFKLIAVAAFAVAVSLLPESSSAQSQTAPQKLASITPANYEALKTAQVLKFVFDDVPSKHGWPSNYVSMWCPSNVAHLIRRLVEARVDVTDAQVLYVVPEFYVNRHGLSEVTPLAARQGDDGPVREWTFHVVLQLKGKILDTDFTDQPTVISTEDYFARMFGKGPQATTKASQALFVRTIPAVEYFNTYRINWGWFLSGAGGRYPAKNLETLFAK